MTSVNLTNYSGKAEYSPLSLPYASVHPHLCRRDLSAGDFFFFPAVELTHALRAYLQAWHIISQEELPSQPSSE